MKTMKNKNIFLCFSILLLFLFCSVSFAKVPENKNEKIDNTKEEKEGQQRKEIGEFKIAQIGSKIEDFLLENKDGHLVKLSNFKGKVAILFFWLPIYENCDKKDCTNKYSIMELNKIKSFYEDLNTDKLIIITITRGKDKVEKEKAKAIFEENNFDFHLLFDPQLKVAQYFWATPQPALHLVDKNMVLKTPVEFPRGSTINSIDVKFGSLKFKDLVVSLLAGNNINEEKILYPILGEKLPSISLEDLNGKKFVIDKVANGKILILIFWHYTCPHCLKELPLIQKYYLKNKDTKDIEVVGIVSAENKEAEKLIEQRIKENSLTFLNLVDRAKKTSKILNEYRIFGVPTILLVDKKGIVKHEISGYHEDTEKIIDGMINSMN